MPKGKGKSKGAVKNGPPPRAMSFVDNDPRALQYYAKIMRIWGNGRIQVLYYGKSTARDWKNDPDTVRLREISANVRQRRGLNKIKIQNNGFVIISLREFEAGAADVLHSYRDDEIKVLRRRHELPSEIDQGIRADEADITFSEHVHVDLEVTKSYMDNEGLDQYGIPIEDDIFTDSDNE
jgi:hypothetical protein